MTTQLNRRQLFAFLGIAQIRMSQIVPRPASQVSQMPLGR